MDKFLDDFIESMTTRQSRRVSDILQEVQVSKEQIGSLVNQLGSFDILTSIIMLLENPAEKLTVNSFQSNFRDIDLSVRELYRINELTSLILESNRSILISEVQEIEQEISVLEKLSQNYTFLLADNNAFNYAFLESFVDESGREEFNHIPDRGELTFGPAQKCYVDSNEGMLVLPRRSLSKATFTPTIIESNVGAYISNRNLSNIVSNTAASGWRESVYTPAPVTSSVSTTDVGGAGIVIEGRLSQPTACSEIKVTPFAGASVVLAQVTIYDSDNADHPTNLMNVPVIMDGGSRTVHFPLTNLQKFTVTLVQSSYSKVNKQTYSESYYRIVSEHSVEKKTQHFINKHQLYRRYKNPELFTQGQRPVHISLPNPCEYSEGGIASRSSLTRMLASSNGRDVALSRSGAIDSPLSSVILSMVKEFDGSLSKALQFRSVSASQNISIQASSMDQSSPALADALSVFASPETPQTVQAVNDAYTYDLGIGSIQIGIESVGFKGFFVTKPFESPGDMGEVRMKVLDKNYRAFEDGLDNSVTTSIEYSISNKANPINEQDWIPILPMGSVVVESERFFPDYGGIGFLRFLADPGSGIYVYKNGVLMDNVNPQDHFIYNNETKQGINAIRMPQGSYGPEDFITITYSPAQDYTVVNFEQSGFTDAPLIAAFGSDGAGESYQGWQGGMELGLQHTPYIDPVQVQASTYTAFGLSPYQAIVVRLEDGTTATNLTNYKLGEQVSFPDSDSLYFIHSGDTLIFNKTITQPFRVFYQYLQNNVRARVVMRCNSKKFVTPKVDFVHVKGKTRRSNREKI